MNITSKSIQYILNNRVKTFKIPKEDRNINFKKWSYNDVIQYIRLNEQKKSSNKPSKSKKKNVIKYARLTTAKNNPLINGKKTLDEIKQEAIIAAHTYGINSAQYKSLIDQITQYSKLILERYYEDYIKNNVGTVNYENMKYQIRSKLHDGLREIIKYRQCYILRIDDKTVSSDLKHHHTGAFSELTGFGFKDEYDELNNNEKMYFKFIIPNDYSVKDVTKKIIETIGESNFKNLKQFYQPGDDYFKMDGEKLEKNKNNLIERKLFPAFLTTYNNDQIIFIPLDIFQFVMSVDNGALSSKIYYCEYNMFNPNDEFYIIGDDLIDDNFIKYFMDDTIKFKGGDTKIAFISKIIDTVLLKINLSIGQYKDIYKNNDNIIGDDVSSIFKDDDYDNKMEIEGEEEKKKKQEEQRKQKEEEQNTINRMKKLKEDYIKNKKNNNDDVYISNFELPKDFHEIKPEDIEDKTSSVDRMKKLKEDYIKNKKNNNDDVYSSDFKPVEVKKVEPKKPIKPLKPIEPLKPVEPVEPVEAVKPIEPFKKVEPMEPIVPMKPIDPKSLKDDDEVSKTTKIPDILPIKMYDCYIYYYRNDGIPTITTIALINRVSKTESILIDIINTTNGETLEEYKRSQLYPILLKCKELTRNKENNIKVYESMIKTEIPKLESFKKTIILTSPLECKDINYCRYAYENLLIDLGYNISSDSDDNNDDDIENIYPKNKNNNDNSETNNSTPSIASPSVADDDKPLIKNDYNIYVSCKNFRDDIRFLYIRAFIVADSDDEILDYTGRNQGPYEGKLYDCYKGITDLINKQTHDYKNYTPEKQMEEINKVIRKYYQNSDIYYLIFDDDDDAFNIYTRASNLNYVDEYIKKHVNKKYLNNGGNGIFNSVKDFINFRKDTKETLYYLLQRIIALESDMKTVKGKIVSNNIRNSFKDNNINLSEDGDDDDNKGNGFMCSRCGMINPKFFKNDYPTLSEFREQFSKL